MMDNLLIYKIRSYLQYDQLLLKKLTDDQIWSAHLSVNEKHLNADAETYNNLIEHACRKKGSL